MRISVSSSVLRDGDVLAPTPPLPPVDINDLFELELLGASKTTFIPFDEIDIEWSIKTIAPGIDSSDYSFSLISTETVLADDISMSDTLKFTPYKNTLLQIRGRRGGGGWAILGKGVALSVDESTCLTVSIPRSIFDSQVKEELSRLTSSTAEIRLRKKTVLVSRNPNIYAEEEMEVVPTWTFRSIKYYFPLEIVSDGFFNADLDVNLEIIFDVDHGDLVNNNSVETNLEVTVIHSSNADYDIVEDILSLGSAPAVAKAINTMLPLILDCKKRDIELKISRMILEFLSLQLRTHRLLDVRIIVGGNVTSTRLDFVLCPLPVEPEPITPDAPGDGGLAPPVG